MTILTSIILVAAIVLVATFIAYQMQKGTKAMSEFKADFDNNEEVQELTDLAKELYNKDLRPVAPKKIIKKKKSEFPIDQPTKKETTVETIAEITTPEVIEKPAIPLKVTPETIIVNVEVAKPKKKRKYYPKKKKTQE